MEDVAGMMSCSKRRSARTEDDEDGLRKGPWTVEEDLRLITCISSRGEGRWNAIAKAAGLRRTGKSCRLRWLNYLRPDLKRGNITPEEQLLILDLHCRFGNQWSKIARHLPGRTDNEIKNYWRTRIQKHIDRVGGNVEMLRYSWIQRFMLFHHATNNNNNNRRNLCCAASNASVIASSTGNDDDNQTLICETAPLNPEIVIQNEFQNQESASASSSAGAKEGSQSETENLNQMCCGSSDDKGNGWLSDWNTECGWDWDTHHNHSSNSSLLWNDQDCFFPL